MSATGEIATIGREGWAVSLGTALDEDLQAFRREFERTAALARLYRG